LLSKYTQIPDHISQTALSQEQKIGKFMELWNAAKPVNSLTSVMSKLLDVLGLKYTSQPWNNRGIDQLMRVIPFSQCSALQLGKAGADTPVLLFRGYSYPGLLSSLITAVPRAKTVLELKVHTVDTDAGIVAHPESIRFNTPLVLTDSPLDFIRAAFHQLISVSGKCEMGLFVSSGSAVTTGNAIAQTRKCVLWTSSIGGSTIDYARRFDAPVSSLGLSEGPAKLSFIGSLPRTKLFAYLDASAKPWTEAVATSPKLNSGELLTTLAHVKLEPSELSLLKSHLPPYVLRELTVDEIEHCPFLQVPLNRMTLEQTTSGWVLQHSNGDREQITNYSFRIVRVVRSGKRLEYQIDIFSVGRWRTFFIPTKKLDKSPFKALNEVTTKAGMIPFTGIPKYSACSPMWAQQLNNVLSATASTHELGVSLTQGVLNANQITVAADGQLGTTGVPTDSKFLSQADRALPDVTSVNAILSSRVNYDVLNALAVQAICYLTGRLPFAVTYGSQAWSTISTVLSRLEVLNQYWPCSFNEIVVQNASGTRIAKAIDDAAGAWLIAGQQWTNWIALRRKTIHLGNAYSGYIDIPERQLQRTLVQLISGAMSYRSGAGRETGPYHCLQHGWTELLRGLKMTSRLPKPKPILTTADAVSYWLQTGVAQGYLSVHNRKPAKYPQAVVVTDDGVRFLRDDISAVIEKSGLPAVNTVQIVSDMISHPQFVSCLPDGKHFIVHMTGIKLDSGGDATSAAS